MEEKIGNEMPRSSFSCKMTVILGKLQERCCTERSTRLIAWHKLL